MGMSEREIAEMEAARNSAEDAYFDARPQIDTGHCRHLFNAGFERAWQAAREQEGGCSSEAAWLIADEHMRNYKVRSFPDGYTQRQKEQFSIECCVSELMHLLQGKGFFRTQPQGVPEWMEKISSALKTQDNRITADPLFIVFQKGEVVVDEDYDHDRIVWVDDEGNEADDEVDAQLNWMRGGVGGEHFMDNEIELIDEDECREEWRRLAIKEVDEFVTACLTETGAESYLKVSGHNLRKPYIFVTSLFRNEEMKRLRDWLLSTPAAPQADEWVKCADRLPEKGVVVLVFVDYAYHAIKPSTLTAHWTGSTFKIGPNSVNFNCDAPVVTHWMPLPQPPEQGDGL